MSRTALISGGTGGIGAAVAAELAASGWQLLVTGRDRVRGQAAESRLLEAGAAGAVFLPTDHTSVAATDELATAVRRHTGVLDLLVANAAAMPETRTITPEGLDEEVAVDVVGVVALVDGLLPLLADASGARVVLVTSDAAVRYPLGIDGNPWQVPRGAAMRAYGRVKRWKLQVAAALAGEMRQAGVVVHAASPGPAWTPMTAALTRQALGAPLPLWLVIRAVQRASSPARAARCVVRAAVDPRLEGSGLLVRGRRSEPIPAEPAAAAAALRTARELLAATRSAQVTRPAGAAPPPTVIQGE